MNLEKIGKFISLKRKEKNLTQKDLANRVKVTNKAISKWETGKGLPDYSTFSLLCKTLDITMEELLNGEEKIKNNNILNEYLNYKKNQEKKKNIVISIITILILIISILGIYFINTYKTISVYELYGESENFTYNNGLLLTSKIKNIIACGELESNTIDDEQILSLSLAYMKEDGEYYLISTLKNGYIIKEDYGYDEYISKEKMKYIPNNLYVLVSYRHLDEEVTEIIKIKAEKVLSNDKLVNLKSKAITSSKNYSKPIDLNENNDSADYKTELLKDGFVEGCYEIIGDCGKYVQKKIGKDEYIVIDYISKQFNYFYRNDDLSVKTSFLLNSEQETAIIIRIKNNEKTGSIVYDLLTEKITHNSFSSETDKAMEIIDLIKKYKQ